MAAPAPTPGSGTTKGLGKIIMTIVIIVVFIIVTAYIRIRGFDKVFGSSAANSAEVEWPILGTPRVITITAERPSEPVPLVDSRGNRLEISGGIFSDTTPYIIHYHYKTDSGELKGFDTFVQARINRPPGWRDTNGVNKALSASFQLPQGFLPVDLTYTLKRQ